MKEGKLSGTKITDVTKSNVMSPKVTDGVVGDRNPFFCSGVSSIASGRKYVLFLDMDGNNEKQTIAKAVDMISNYKLSDCYVIRSSRGNYHIICLDKMYFGYVIGILQKYAHSQWVKFRSVSKDFVLRLSEKGDKKAPVLVVVVDSPYRERKMSNAHRIMMNKNYGTKIRKTKHFDNNKKLKLHVYRTRITIG